MSTFVLEKTLLLDPRNYNAAAMLQKLGRR